MSSILITGASGNIGIVLAEHLKTNHRLTLVDIDFSEMPTHLMADSTIKKTDLTKPGNWNGLLEGIEYVIHLAGDPSPEAGFYDSLLDMNFKLTYNLFEEALKEHNHVKRIIFASSVHAIGSYPDNVQVKTSDYPRPADLYGVSKVFMEALASYHAYSNGQEAIGIRIGAFNGNISPGIANADAFSVYLSERDLCHLVDCCLEATLKEPFLLVNGVSNNRFPRMDIYQAHVDIGYTPQDDAFEMQGSGVYDFKEEPDIDMDSDKS